MANQNIGIRIPPRWAAHDEVRKTFQQIVQKLGSDSDRTFVTLTTTGGRIQNITESTGSTTIVVATNYHISIQYTDTGTHIATLPAISAANHGQLFHVKDADYNASVNNITVATTGDDTIEEEASGLMTLDGESWTLMANNTKKNWELQ